MRIKPGVHAARGVLHRTLEQQIAGRPRGHVILQRAEVVHLGVVGVVQRNLAGAGALPDDLDVGAHSGVLAAEGDRGQQRGRVAVADGLLMAELPHRRAELVDRHVRDPGSLLCAHEQPRHHQRRAGSVGDEPLDDGDLAVLAGVDDQPREGGFVVAVDCVGDDDRRRDMNAPRDRQHGLAVERCAELVEDVVHDAVVSRS